MNNQKPGARKDRRTGGATEERTKEKRGKRTKSRCEGLERRGRKEVQNTGRDEVR